MAQIKENAAEPATEKKPAATKKAAAKATTSQTTAKKTTAKKTTAAAKTTPAKKTSTEKKTPARKTQTAASTEPQVNFFVEFNGVQVSKDEVLSNIKMAYEADGNTDPIESLDVYLLPEKSEAYYVVNGKLEGKMIKVYFV